MIVNSVCKQCDGLCCKGGITGHPKCRWLSEDKGCMTCPDHRDAACNIYPFIIVEDHRYPNKRRVFLDTACPYFQEFAKMRDQIKDTDGYSLVILEGTYRK